VWLEVNKPKKASGYSGLFFTVDEDGDKLRKDRSEDDRQWELGVVNKMRITSLYDVSTTSSKMQILRYFMQVLLSRDGWQSR